MYIEPKIILALSVSTEDCCDRRYCLYICVFMSQRNVILEKYSIATQTCDVIRHYPPFYVDGVTGYDQRT